MRLLVIKVERHYDSNTGIEKAIELFNAGEKHNRQSTALSTELMIATITLLGLRSALCCVDNYCDCAV